MVVDTSALMALLLAEPEAGAIDRLLVTTPELVMSAANHVELMIVAETRSGAPGVLVVNELLQQTEIRVEAVSPRMAQIAVDAWRRYGKGRHRAGLNFGDCFAYALATVRAEPLLFVGRDFSHTDVVDALAAD